MLLIENDDFQELPYVLDHEKYFGKQHFEIGKGLVFSRFVMEENTCSCFYVSNLCVGLKLKYFQQEDINKDLRASFTQKLTK